MKKYRERSSGTQAYLKRLKNPYASLQVEEEFEGNEVSAPKSGGVRSRSDTRSQIIRRLQNPYAALAPDEELGLTPEHRPVPDGTQSQSGRVRLQARQEPLSVSKAAFRERCRSIFRDYMPAAERGRLRQHYRDFIARNETRPPDQRGYLLHVLKKYDLSSTRGLSTQFNREDKLLTDAKLEQIERFIDDE